MAGKSTMNEDICPIGKKVEFQSTMLVYWRVVCVVDQWELPKPQFGTFEPRKKKNL